LNLENENRQLIPRWVSSTDYIAENSDNNIVYAIKASKPSLKKFFEESLSEWISSGSIIHAVDLVGIAYLIGDFEHPSVKKAADYILTHEKNVSNLALDLTHTWLRGLDKISNVIYRERDKNFYYSNIRILKKYVREYPLNPIAWLDAAYYYSLLGQKEKASKAITIALNINSENTYILRSASRFFVYQNRPDKALFYLRKACNAKNDPQIMSAEIAISEISSTKSRLVKIAQKNINNLLQNTAVSTELLASLSTLEFLYGKRREGIRLIKEALESPNENSLTQAVSLQNRGYIKYSIDLSSVNVAHRYEADSWIELKAGNYEKAFEEAKKWLIYQPISSRAAIYASYLASTALRANENAIKILSLVRHIHPYNSGIINNLAFAYASINEPRKAIEELRRIRHITLDENSDAVISATTGLVEFRKGNIESGRNHYHKAITFFKSKGDEVSLARASLIWGREEARIGSDKADHILAMSEKASRKKNLNEVLSYIDFILDAKKREFFSIL